MTTPRRCDLWDFAIAVSARRVLPTTGRTYRIVATVGVTIVKDIADTKKVVSLAGGVRIIRLITSRSEDGGPWITGNHVVEIDVAGMQATVSLLGRKMPTHGDYVDPLRLSPFVAFFIVTFVGQ